MDGSIRLDLRLLAIATTLVAIGLLVALIATTDGRDEALTQTALVLAVIAFIADLAIALTSYMAAGQSEARLRETNSQMQAAIAQVDARTDEVRNLVRLQGEKLLDMVGQRVLASSSPEQRRSVEAVLGQMRHQIRDEPILPPGGGVQGRREQLERRLAEWVREQGHREVGPKRGQTVMFEANGVIHVVVVKAGNLRIMTPADFMDLGWIKGEIAADWPGKDVRMGVLIEDPDLSGWDPRDESLRRHISSGTRVVTLSQLSDLLLDPGGRQPEPDAVS